jgi:hypothetical protein
MDRECNYFTSWIFRGLKNCVLLTIRKVHFDVRDVDNFAQVYTKYIDEHLEA